MGIFILYIFIGFIVWCIAAKHMYGLMTNYKPEMKTGMQNPKSISRAEYFTEAGNFHRERLVRYGFIFCLMVLIPLLVITLVGVIS
jgi:hypothetical protein